MWVQTDGRVDPGQVVNPTSDPRSYIVERSYGMVRRNQVHVTPRPAESNQNTTTTVYNSESRAVTRSQTDTLDRLPPRLSYWIRRDVVDW